jgi:hypothetical protein
VCGLDIVAAPQIHARANHRNATAANWKALDSQASNGAFPLACVHRARRRNRTAQIRDVAIAPHLFLNIAIQVLL